MACDLWSKTIVHLWATGEEFFLSSFLFMKEMPLQLGFNSFEVCLTRAYLAFMSRCKFFEPEKAKHIENLGDSLVELYSLDVQNSYQKVLASLQQLSLILQKALNTKKKVYATSKKITICQLPCSMHIIIFLKSLNI